MLYKKNSRFTHTPNFGVSLRSKRGFTIIELVIVIAIVTILSAITILNYFTFNDRLALSSAGQEMAVAIRQAQSYGLNVRETSASSGNFNSAYGIFFNTDLVNPPTEYYIFIDSNLNVGNLAGRYDPGSGCGSGITECLEKVSLRNGVTITGIDSSSGCPSVNSAESISITFIRPNPDANISFYRGNGTVACTDQADAQVTLTSKNGASLVVNVYRTGQVYVQ